jgi:hypothetical protein
MVAVLVWSTVCVSCESQSRKVQFGAKADRTQIGQDGAIVYANKRAEMWGLMRVAAPITSAGLFSPFGLWALFYEALFLGDLFQAEKHPLDLVFALFLRCHGPGSNDLVAVFENDHEGTPIRVVVVRVRNHLAGRISHLVAPCFPLSI